MNTESQTKTEFLSRARNQAEPQAKAAEANARLIAAAPELLAKLKESLFHLERENDNYMNEFLVQIRAAIAKAEGKNE